MLDRLIRAILGAPRDSAVPPITAPPPVQVTPHAERSRIDARLRENEVRLAELQALAGLDELRTRGSRPHAD